MHTAMKTTPIDLRRTAACAALATLTTLGLFSLIANVMPPLVADTLVLATAHETVCIPTAQAARSADPATHSAI